MAQVESALTVNSALGSCNNPHSDKDPSGGVPIDHPCPYCSYLTFPVSEEEAIAYIYPVCCWENDMLLGSLDEASDENHGTTPNEVRANFQECRAYYIETPPYMHPPKQEGENP